jgi:hypothetical protein
VSPEKCSSTTNICFLRFQTNETSPLTNLVLDSLDLVPDLNLKQEILDYIKDEDITSRYKNLRNDMTLLRCVSIKSIFNR